MLKRKFKRTVMSVLSLAVAFLMVLPLAAFNGQDCEAEYVYVHDFKVVYDAASPNDYPVVQEKSGEILAESQWNPLPQCCFNMNRQTFSMLIGVTQDSHGCWITSVHYWVICTNCQAIWSEWIEHTGCRFN